MSIHSDIAPVVSRGPAPAEDIEEAWELDITIVESGPTADKLIRMTNDGCGQTCESACSTTCP